MSKKVKSRGIKCAICNTSNELLTAPNKICINCYFTHDRLIPEYIPVEQHDLWIINYHERE